MRGWLALRHATRNSPDSVEEVLCNLAGPAVPKIKMIPKADIAKYSPTLKAPVLIDKALDVTVCESLAVVLHVADRFPESELMPIDKAARAMCLSASSEMYTGFMGLRTYMPHNCQVKALKHGALALQKSEVLTDILRLGNMFTDLRKRFGADGKYLFGKFSAADCMYAPVSVRFNTYDPELSSLSQFPAAQEYMRTLYAHDLVQQWISEAAAEGPETYLDYYETVSDTYVPPACSESK
jgi:glutathione S-transferase